MHPIEVKRSAYRNSSESALTLINSMLSLIESYVDMPLNSSLKGCYKELCVKAIDLFRTYIGNDKIGFTALIQKQSSYQFLESQRLAMDRVSDCENYPQGAEGVMGDTRYGAKVATDADKNEEQGSTFHENYKGSGRQRNGYGEKEAEDREENPSENEKNKKVEASLGSKTQG